MNIMRQAATKILIRNCIYETFWPLVACPWGGHLSRPQEVGKLWWDQSFKFSALPFPACDSRMAVGFLTRATSKKEWHKLYTSGHYLLFCLRELVTSSNPRSDPETAKKPFFSKSHLKRWLLSLWRVSQLDTRVLWSSSIKFVSRLTLELSACA